MESWLRRTTPVAPQRTLIGSTDLVLVARDGVERAHQALLARHSRILRRLFWDLSRLTEVELINSKIPGIKPRLTESREPCDLVTLLLPDYGIRTVSALLDLLYQGQSKDCGQYTSGGELELVGLYADLGLEREYGGLPAIDLLEEVEIEENMFPACKPAQVTGEVVSSTTEPEEKLPRENPVDDLILVVSETLGVTEEILLPSEPLVDNQADEEDRRFSASFEAEPNDAAVEEEVAMDEETIMPCGDSDGRAESRMQSPEPEIDELLGEGSDVSRPASQMSSNEEDAFLVENSTTAPESVKEYPEDALASQSSPEMQDKSKGKRICLRKKSTSESDPEHSQSSHGFSDTDVEMARKRNVEMARKRRRSMLGEEYDSQMKSKQRRLMTADENKKRALSSSEEGTICPVEECGKELGGDVEKIAKHLIKHHLSKPPSCLYTDEKDSGSHRCKPCDFSSSSLSSFWAHMAVKHREMHTRLGQALDGKGLSEDEAGTYRVVDAFWKQVWRRGKDREQSNHKSKIVAKVFASSDSAKQSPKKKSVATASGVMTCATCGKESKTWRKLKEHVIGRHLQDKLADHYSFNADEKSFYCEYGQECIVQRKNKRDIMMHLHCKHQVVTEQQVLEIAKKVQAVGETEDAGDEQNSAMVAETVAETVKTMNRQDCEVKMFNILEGVDHPSDVSDISNYSKLRKPQRHRLPSTSGAGGGERGEERSPLQGSKKSKKPAKEKKEANSAEQLPGLFTCPLVLKSQSSSTTPSTSTSEPASTEAASNRSSTPKPLPKSMQDKRKSIERDKAEIDPAELMNPAKSPADEEELMKGEDSANAGVYTCRWCLYKYYEDRRLKEHLLSQHKNEFKEVSLLEAGEKNYECTYKDCKKLSKSHAQFKNKSRVKYLRHLKEVHDVMVLELLLESTELDLELGHLFNFKEFCVKLGDLDHLIEKWEAPVVIKPRRQLEPEMVQLEDSVDEVGNDEEEIQIESGSQADEVEAPNYAEEDNQESEAEVKKQVFSQEEKSDITCDVNVVDSNISGRRNTGEVDREEETKFTCQICDQTFLDGLAVSLHMFQEHLKGLTSVWDPLVKPASPAAFPHSWTCVLCSDTFPTRTTAQLHIYTESQHKRRLKHSMEDRRENWQHTLEFVRFKIPVDKILEDDEDDDHVVGEQTVTSSTVEVKAVTTGSVETVEEPEPEEIHRYAAKDASAVPAGEEAFKLDSEPDHLELDYEPEEEDNNNGDVVVNQPPRHSLVQSSEVKGCDESMSNSVEGGAGDQVKEDGRENREKIDRAAFEGEEEEEGMSEDISCSHARGGCAKTFASRIEVHIHARKCQFRPSSSFRCSTHGCGKRYYYEEDFERHRLRCLDLDEFQCQDCDFFSSSVKEIIEHKMSTHL